MKPSVYRVPIKAAGALYMMPKPSSDWLADDVGAYRAMGMVKIISLLTQEEIAELGLSGEGEVCARKGVNFVRFPIPDRGLADPVAFSALVRQTHRDLVAGVTTAVHCRAGIGRSGTLVCCVLKHTGMTAQDAVSAVSAARGVSVPDTAEQLDFIGTYAVGAPDTD